MRAFPILSLLQDRDDNYSLHQEGGLTKRELFAAMAMQGLLGDNRLTGDHALFARESVLFADALLTELENSHA